MSRVILILMLTIFANASLFDFKKLWNFENSYNNKNYKEALKALDEYGKDTPVINYNRANTLYKMGRYEEAITYYKKAHSKDVNEVDRLFNIGNCFFKLKDYDNAIFTYKLILKYRDDKDTKANLKLALLKKLEALKKKKETKNKKNKKKKSSKKEKNGKKKSKTKKRKLTKQELLKLKKMQKEQKFKRELRQMLNKSLRDKKVPVLMYKIDGKKSNINKELNPW